MKLDRRSAGASLWTIALAAIVSSAGWGCSETAEPPPPATQSGANPAPAAQTPPATAVPTPSSASVAADGFPTGQGTAEGVAADLARAFINYDSTEFGKLCLPGTGNAEYTKFMNEMAVEIDNAKKMAASDTQGPAKIGKVFKARNLSSNGPASAGYAMHRLSSVQFVDVETPLKGGELYTNRTLVVQRESDSLWYAIPMPEAYPMLSAGLNSETESTELWVATDTAAPKR